MRKITNDVAVFNIDKLEVTDQMHFNIESFKPRMYHSGFVIENSIFTLGGLTLNGQLICDF